MKKIRFQSLVGVCFIFLFSLNASLILAGLITNQIWFIVAAVTLSLSQIILYDSFKGKHSILKNYACKATLQYLSGKISPIISKFLFGNGLFKAAVSPEQYELIINRAKNIPTDIVRNTLSHPDDPDFECIRYVYNNTPLDFKINDLRVKIGTAQCSQPYSMSVLNIGALNQAALSNASVRALSEGANIQGCAVNTGKAGINSYLIRGGGDLIWQIAQEDYTFRNDDSSFNEKFYQVTATRPYIKMIEIVLPRHDVMIMRRVAGDRLIKFLGKLRNLSGGKPIGVRLFNPGKEVVNSICKSMYATGVHLDFITIEGATSINGFDAFNLSKASSSGYLESLASSRKSIDNYGLPTKIIASGAIVTEYEILRSIALGASVCYCTLPMIIAINSNAKLRIKDSVGQRVRVANFHRNTIQATLKLMKLCRYKTLEDVKPEDFYSKTNSFEIKSLKEIYFNDNSVASPHLFSGLN